MCETQSCKYARRVTTRNPLNFGFQSLINTLHYSGGATLRAAGPSAYYKVITRQFLPPPHPIGVMVMPRTRPSRRLSGFLDAFLEVCASLPCGSAAVSESVGCKRENDDGDKAGLHCSKSQGLRSD